MFFFISVTLYLLLISAGVKVYENFQIKINWLIGLKQDVGIFFALVKQLIPT